MVNLSVVFACSCLPVVVVARCLFLDQDNDGLLAKNMLELSFICILTLPCVMYCSFLMYVHLIGCLLAVALDVIKAAAFAVVIP